MTDLEQTPAAAPSAWFARVSEAARANTPNEGAAHDFQHALRVAHNAELIAAKEGAREEIVVAAALLHELFNYPKNHPESSRSGDVCAERASALLEQLECPADDRAVIAACIRDHAFSKGVVPESLEARVLQDADRLDAVGAIGIARCFATCGELGQTFYEPQDPFCAGREPNDRMYGIDHFFRKLFQIESRLNTETARAMVRERSAYMWDFLAQLQRELDPRAPSPQDQRRARATITALAKHLDHADPAVRARVVGFLGEHGRAAADYAPALEALRERDDGAEIRRVVDLALAQMGEDGHASPSVAAEGFLAGLASADASSS